MRKNYDMSTGNPWRPMDLNKSTENRRLHLREVADEEDGLPRYEGMGRDLRAARLKANMERKQVAKNLHIKLSYVHAIEDGKFEELPASVSAYGFVRSYAELLGLDEDLIVSRFKNEWEGLGTSTRLAFPEPPEEIRLPRGPLIVGSCVIAVAIYGGWYYFSQQGRFDLPRVAEVPSQLVVETETSIPNKKAGVAATPSGKPAASAAKLGQKTALPKVSPAELPATKRTASAPIPAVTEPVKIKKNTPKAPIQIVKAVPKQPPTVAANVVANVALGSLKSNVPTKYGDTNTGRITLRARADTWVRVQTDEDDGQVYLGRILHMGDEFRLPDRDDLFLMTGNAGGLEIRVDGKKVAGIGSLGMVRRRVLLDPDRLIAGTAVDDN